MSQQLNLVNPALLPPKPFFQFRSMMLSLAVMAVVLVAFAMLILSQLHGYEQEAAQSAQRVTTKQAQMAALEQTSTKRVVSPQLLDEQSAVAAESQRLQQLAGQLAQLGSRQTVRSRADLLFALAERPSKGVWLTALEVTGEHISFDGMTLSAAHLPVWLAELQQSPVFAGQRFGGLQLGQGVTAQNGETTAYAFRLEASPKGAAAPGATP